MTTTHRFRRVEVPVFTPIWGGPPPPFNVATKTYKYDDGDEKVIDEIYGEIRQVREEGFDPRFIILGSDKYEQLMMTLWVRIGSIFPTRFSGLPIVVIPDKGVVRVSTYPKQELVHRSERSVQ